MTFLKQQEDSQEAKDERLRGSSGFASEPIKVAQVKQHSAQDKPIDVLCRGKTELFFSERTKDMQVAQAICMSCPGQPKCLAQARANPPYAGVWGGVIFVDGEELLFKRGRGRPAKNENDTSEANAAALKVLQIA